MREEVWEAGSSVLIVQVPASVLGLFYNVRNFSILGLILTKKNIFEKIFNLCTSHIFIIIFAG